MKIGSFQKFSLIDFPDKACSIIFTQGCNFRCPFCHNPELVLPELFQETIAFEDILQFLKKRVGLIDAVEFTGGEPIIQQDIKEKIMRIKELGFLVKLDTNGSLPEALGEVLNLVDYIAMDIKAPLEEYSEFVRAKVDTEAIKLSIKTIMDGAKDYEFRTTLIKGFHDRDKIEKMAMLVKGSKRYFLQKPRFKKTVDLNFNLTGEFTDLELAEFKRLVSRFAVEVKIR